MGGFRFSVTVASAAAILTTLSAPLPAQPRRGGAAGGECAFFADANFQGARAVQPEGENPWVGDAWNDRISSVQCDPGCTLEVYEHIDFGGARERFRGNVPFVGPVWNDRASSLRVNCEGRGWARDDARAWPGRRPGRGACTYYADANYQGMRGVQPAGENRWVGDGWNDRISSVQCDPGCTLEAYEHIDFGGARERFRGSVAFVGPAWNDRTSSLRVSCG